MVKKRSRKNIALCALFLALTVLLTNVIKTDEINKVLKSESYKDLPIEAKEYIKSIYEENGYILLTEKNKEENMPYLNPRYIAYLEASEEKKKEYSVVPNAVISDYVDNGDKVNKTFPAKFDLRNVDGVNYTTPNRNQSSSGLCAFFTTVATLESNLLYQSKTPYSNSAEKFSERQFDYALSYNGMIEKEGTTEDKALLTDGANFEDLVRVGKDGLGFIDLNKMPFDLSKNKKPMSEVLSFTNSKYELNETINFEYLDTEYEDQETIDSYIKMIKDHVMTYGGVYVATAAPNGGCAYQDSKLGNYVIYDTNDTREDDKCTLRYHAMEIIGWDDDVEYEFCANSSTKTHSANVSGCSSENLISGKGAWILKNSWGTSHTNPYLAYNSRNSAYNAIISYSKTSDRNWDKIYRDSEPERVKIGSDYALVYELEKDNNLVEKLDKIKLEVNWVRYLDIDVYYSPTGSTSNKTLLDTKEEADASLYTIDITSDIEIKDGAAIIIQSTSPGASGTFASYMQTYGEVTAYAKTIDEDVYMNTEDITASKTNNDNTYNFYAFTTTQNIDSGELLKFELYDENNKKINDKYITYTENAVGPNEAISNITITNDIPKGNYTLRTVYGEDYSESTLTLSSSDSSSNYAYIKYDFNRSDKDIEYVKVNISNNYELEKDVENYEGFNFKEWNTKEDGTGNTILNSTDLSLSKGNVKTVYAIYNNKSYKIIFNSNNNRNEKFEQNANISENTILKDNEFEYEYYNFIEWNTKEDGTGTGYHNKAEVIDLVNVGEEIQLYAIWEVQSYNIIYHSNDDKNETVTDNVVINQDYHIRGKITEFEGMNFAGWDTNQDGTGTRYKEDQKVSFLGEDKETINLYAIWSTDYLVSDKYEVTEEKIEDINDNTSVENFKRNLIVDNSYTVKIEKNGTELSASDVISTGSITYVYDGDELKSQFVNIVPGDVNGSGTITISDVAKIFSHIMGFSNLDEDYNISAADVNGSNSITISDVSKIYSYIMGFNGGVV